MARIVVPSCFLLSSFGPSEAGDKAMSAVGRFRTPSVGVPVLLIDADLLVADPGFGVLAREPAGVWNAYVMKSASERWTSAL